MIRSQIAFSVQQTYKANFECFNLTNIKKYMGKKCPHGF